MLKSTLYSTWTPDGHPNEVSWTHFMSRIRRINFGRKVGNICPLFVRMTKYGRLSSHRRSKLFYKSGWFSSQNIVYIIVQTIAYYLVQYTPINVQWTNPKQQDTAQCHVDFLCSSITTQVVGEKRKKNVVKKILNSFEPWSNLAPTREGPSFRWQHRRSYVRKSQWKSPFDLNSFHPILRR